MENKTDDDDENDDSAIEEVDSPAFLQHNAPNTVYDQHHYRSSMEQQQESEGKLGDNNDMPSSFHHQQDPMSVSVVDSLLLQYRRSQQQDLSLADVYRIRRDQDQLQYMQEQLEQQARLQALLRQQQMIQQPPQIQDLYSDYETARHDLLLRRLLQQRQEQQQQQLGDLRQQRHDSIFPGGVQSQLSPEAKLYDTALRESATARQQQSSLLSQAGYNLPWGDSNPFDSVVGQRRSMGADVLSGVTSGGAAAAAMGDSMSASASLRGAAAAQYAGGGAAGLVGAGGGLDTSRSTTAHSLGGPPSPRKRATKGGGWPKDRPKRPLSAYNIFFKEERARILAEIPESTAATGTEPTDADAPSPTPPPTSRRRRNRNTHGKISFESLAKTIGRRWQEQTPEQVRYYKDKAEVDMRRYRNELQKYNNPDIETKGAEEDQKPAARDDDKRDDKKPPDDEE